PTCSCPASLGVSGSNLRPQLAPPLGHAQQQRPRLFRAEADLLKLSIRRDGGLRLRRFLRLELNRAAKGDLRLGRPSLTGPGFREAEPRLVKCPPIRMQPVEEVLPIGSQDGVWLAWASAFCAELALITEVIGVI